MYLGIANLKAHTSSSVNDERLTASSGVLRIDIVSKSLKINSSEIKNIINYLHE
jgi:hypothetical protein